MTGKEKIEAALSPGGSPEIAALICYEDIYIRDHWKQLSSCPWWYSQSPDLDQQITWIRQVVPKIGQDWMHIPACPPKDYRQNHSIEERGGEAILVNGLTGQKTCLVEPVVGGWEHFERGYSGHVERLAQTPAEIDRLIPDLSPFDPVRYAREGRLDLAEQVRAEFGDELFTFRYVSSPLWGCYSLWGFEDMMAMIAQSPGLVEYACQRYLVHRLYDVREAAALGAGGLWIEDCMTDMISPQAFKVLNLPLIQRLVEEIRSLGMKSIYYFCGNPRGKLDLLLESGADALALEESKKGFTIDIAEVAEAVQGKCALFGNLDAISLLPHGSEADLRLEINRQIQAGRKNRSRFVMSLGSPVTPGTTPERVRFYCDLVHELGI